MTANESDQLKCQASNIRADERINAIENQLKTIKADTKEFYNRIRELERSGAVQDAKFNSIMEKLENIDESVEVLKDIPSKRWNSAVDKVIFAVIGAVTSYLLLQLGL